MEPTRLVAGSALAAIMALVMALGGASASASGSFRPPGHGPATFPNGGPGGDWRLAFRDEFSGSSLDLGTWRPNWFGSNDREVTAPLDADHSDSCIDPRMASVSEGELRLRVERRRCRGNAYAGAAVSSNPEAGGDFEFTYGYLEFRAILPAERGMWTALWANGQTWPDDGEIDVLESGLPSATAQKWHYHDSTVGIAGGRVEVPGASTDWHTYAADWEPGRVTWYYDGDLVTTIATGEIGVPHYLMMNVSDWKQSNPSGPATTRIDYVRVWQRYPDPVVGNSASARVVGKTLVVKGGKRAADNLRISRASGSSLRVTDLPGSSYGGSKLEAGAGCTQTGRYAADCHGQIAHVRIVARDRADKVINSTGVGSSLLGGGAKDTLIGGSEDDVLIGGPGADAMEGRNGDDVLRARDMASDRAIDCGAGTDRAILDKRTKDPGSAVKGCETTTRR